MHKAVKNLKNFGLSSFNLFKFKTQHFTIEILNFKDKLTGRGKF
jgi:hypothetical protein